MHRSTRRLLHALPAVLLLLTGPGCSRKFFRERADRDVEGVLTQKNQFPDWELKQWHVYPDPRARFADPYNPDRPPYPPDDYAARVLSPNPQHPTKKSGTGRVDGEGYLRLLEQWDAENRAEERTNARGAPPERVFFPRPPYQQPAGTSSNRPAASSSAVVSTTDAAVLPDPLDVSPWVSAKPRIAGTETTLAGPSVIESHAPTIVPVGATEGTGPAQTVAVSTIQPPPLTPSPDSKAPATQTADPKTAPGAVPGARSDPGAGQFPSIEKLLATGPQRDDYIRQLTTNQRGFRLKMDQAVQLGIINAREFQDEREDLYLAALPVTLQRFNLAAQGFFTEQLMRTSAGNQLTGAGQSLSSVTTPGFQKLFPTGAALLVQMANQVVIDFGSGKPTAALSNLSLSLSQPFLQGGGFAVTLEPLTQAERTLLYAMRSYARFRKIFYVSVVTGGGLTNNPYGLTGLSQNLGRGIGENLTAPTIGFLPILQSGAIVINNKKNVESLERYFRQYQAFREGGQLSDLQVGLVEVQMLNSEAILLGSNGTTGAPGSIRGYLDALDNFKLQLGLPLTVGLDLDIGPLKPIHQQLTKYERLYADVRQAEDESHRFNPNEPINETRARWRRLLTGVDLVKGTAFARGIGERWDSWSKLSDDQIAARLAVLRKERSDLLDRRVDRQQKGVPEPESETRKLAVLEAEIDLALFERAIRTYEAQPWLKVEAGRLRAIAQAAAFRDVFNAFYQLVLEARNERLAVIHAEWPKLPALPVNGVDVLVAPLDDAYTAGIQAALSTRLDLMNARSQVVDSYRQIAVTANALQGVLNVQYNLNETGTTTQPAAFAPGRTQNQLVVNAQLPLVRRAERNSYRAALINYQSTRRLMMAFEDNIANDVRNDVRQMRALAEVYKIQQRVVELGYNLVENAASVLFAPPAPGTVLDPGTAAAQTTQLLTAQSNLLAAQNTLYTYWVAYLSNRIQLYLDLELIQLDDRGVWRDEQIPGVDSPPQPVPAGRQPGEQLPAPIPVGPADRK